MPTQYQYETVKSQINDLMQYENVVGVFQIGERKNGYPPRIIILREGKVYHFSDPDWNVVIKQLKFLENKIKNASLINQ